MYYTLGEKTLHFYRYQCRYYVAHWDGGHVMTEQFKPFIAGISEKTGLEAKRVEAVARDYFTNVDNSDRFLLPWPLAAATHSPRVKSRQPNVINNHF